MEFDFARRTCISLARPFHLSAEQFDPNYLLRASTVPNLKDSGAIMLVIRNQATQKKCMINKTTIFLVRNLVYKRRGKSAKVKRVEESMVI